VALPVIFFDRVSFLYTSLSGLHIVNVHESDMRLYSRTEMHVSGDNGVFFFENEAKKYGILLKYAIFSNHRHYLWLLCK
jgi:hypothetical protein